MGTWAHLVRVTCRASPEATPTTSHQGDGAERRGNEPIVVYGTCMVLVWWWCGCIFMLRIVSEKGREGGGVGNGWLEAEATRSQTSTLDH